LKTVSNPPSACVRLRDLHRPEGHVGELVNCTAKVLNNLPLQKLFVIAKGYDLETRTEYGVEEMLRWYARPTEVFGRTKRGIKMMLSWLPHVWSESDRFHDYYYDFDRDRYGYRYVSPRPCSHHV